MPHILNFGRLTAVAMNFDGVRHQRENPSTEYCRLPKVQRCGTILIFAISREKQILNRIGIFNEPKTLIIRAFEQPGLRAVGRRGQHPNRPRRRLGRRLRRSYRTCRVGRLGDGRGAGRQSHENSRRQKTRNRAFHDPSVGKAVGDHYFLTTTRHAGQPRHDCYRAGEY